MTFRRQVFLAAARAIRALPRMRGKVHAGQILYRLANRANQPWVIYATLFDERLGFRLNLTSAHERMAFLMNGYESETSALLARLYQGGSILDIGANIGLVAVPLAARTRGTASHEPHLFAFEALLSNHEALAFNVTVNGFEAIVKTLPIALGSERKTVKIQIEGDDPTRTGTANILPDEFTFKPIELEVHALDDLIESASIPRDVTLMKIDTDGYDLEVLRGARGLLKRQRPICHVELNLHCLSWHRQTLEDVLSLMKEVGYAMLSRPSYKSQLFRPYDRKMPFFDNALLVPSEKLDAMLQIANEALTASDRRSA